MNIYAMSLAVVAGVCLPALAQLRTENPNRRNDTPLATLPPDAQGQISAALGKDNSGYWFHQSSLDFRGENLRQWLTAEFTREGAEVRGQNLRWGLEMRGYGYGDALCAVRTVAPTATANRVEYRRDGITEWYENGPLGFEQGFTLAYRLGKESGQVLTLELAMRGDLVPMVEQGGTALELKRKDGTAALRYTGLEARDATGRMLPSWQRAVAGAGERRRSALSRGGGPIVRTSGVDRLRRRGI